MRAYTLAEPLVFTGGITRQTTADAPVTEPPASLRKNDVLLASTGEQLLLISVDGRHLRLVRMDKWRIRRFGGVAYRKWYRKGNQFDFYGEAIGPWVPPPRRARPLIGRRRHWPDMVLPAGTKLVAMGSALTEGTHD